MDASLVETDEGPAPEAPAPVHPAVAPSDILTGPLGRPLLRLALPMLFGYLAQIGFNWVDTFLVARLGPEALAALGSSMFVSWGLIHLVEVVAVGTLALVARAIGAGDPEGAGGVAVTGGLLALGLGLLGAALGPWVAAGAVGVMGLEPAPAALAESYLRVLLWGFPTLSGFFLLESVFRGAGRPRVPMAVLGGALVLNVVLDLVLIFGAGPIPALGVQGAALATVIARGLGCAVLLAVLVRSHRDLGLRLPAGLRRLDPARVRRIVKIGAPTSAAGLSFVAIYLLLLRVTAEVGGTPAVAALGLGIRLECLSYMVLLALGRAAATMAGQNLGARQPERARAAVRRAVLLGTAAMVPWALVLFWQAEPLARLFVDEPVVVHASVTYLWIVALAMIPTASEVILDNVAGGVGDTVPAMGIEVVGTLLRIPLALGLHAWLDLGYVAVWVAIAATMVLKGVAFEVWLNLGRWTEREP